jgi:hypothetical protein
VLLFLDFDKCLFAIHPQQYQPNNRKTGHGLDKSVPRATPFFKTTDENVPDVTEIKLP